MASKSRPSAGEHRRRRLPALLAVALASPAMLALTCSTSAGQAHASTSTVAAHHAAATPAAFIGCFFGVDKPFWLRKGGPLYGKGGITRCTVPPPDECKLEVELEENGNGIFHTWGTVGHPASSGWKRCGAVRPQTPSYRCRSIIARREFRTLAILTTLYRGRSGVGHIYSHTEYEWCE